MSLKTTHVISIDMMKTDTPPVVRMKQGDRLTREVTVNLLSEGSVWAAPSEVTVLQLAYCKSDKVGGCYDLMPDNSAAGTFTAARTAVTMQLHPQVLNVAGDVFCELRLLTNSGNILNAFNFIVNVQKSPIAMTLASEGYYNNVFDGATFTPHISKDGILSWTNDKNLPNPETVTIQGPKGPAGPQGEPGEPGEPGGTSLPVAKASSMDGKAYTAYGKELPEVIAGSEGKHEGKGKQIIFVPDMTNTINAPMLKINESSEKIPIRFRAPKNQGADDDRPDATLLVPIGALMKGVPYTLTFCGMYWLVDSQIAQLDPYQADMLRRFADKAEGLTDSDSIGVPVINSRDGVAGEMALAMVNRSAAEEQTPDQDGNVTIPTEGRVRELVEQAGASADIAGGWDNVETIAPTKDADGYMELEKDGVSMTLPIPKELATVAYVDGLVPPSAQGRVDVTEQYAAWTPTAGSKTAAEFAKTLPDGQYALNEDDCLVCLIDVLTVAGIQWRILRAYDDNFVYIDAYCGTLLAYSAESESGSVSVGGRRLLNEDNFPLPAVADAGKILMASASGRAQWTAIANAEEVAV